MKVLVATRQFQGELLGDFFRAVEGELVNPDVMQCDSPSPFGRGFVGVASQRSTTTAMVVDRPEIDADELGDALFDSLERGGWTSLLDPETIEEIIDEHLECIELVCKSFPVGTVVRRWGTRIWSHVGSAAA